MPERFDVAVVGGGTAGVAAAVTAAELGARTLLVERSQTLGGNAVLALVHTICGLYESAEAGDAVSAHPGFPSRFARLLQRAGAAAAPQRAGTVWVLPTDPPRLAAVAMALCARTRGLEVRLAQELVAVSLEGDARTFHRLRLRDPAGRECTSDARVVIDTSGDAVVSELGGAVTHMAEPDALQLPSYIFRLNGIDTAALSELAGFERLRITHAIGGAVRSRDLPAGCESVLVRPGADDGQIYMTLNVPRPTDRPYAPLEPECVAALESRARRDASRIVEFLRHSRPAFEKCRVDAWPERVGIRETRRLDGIETIDRDSVLEGRRHPDEIAVSTWPIELWQDHRRPRFELPSGPCSIPLGALVSRSHPRLGTAGRCISADHDALGALRVIGTALATGEAIGVAAARAADTGANLSAVAASEVRGHIRERAERSPPGAGGVAGAGKFDGATE
ncbi:MAG: FAD-dependent oxidoreductase [Myxococcota bacterium]